MTRRIRRDAHTGWCAGGHHCGLGEHRSHPITVDLAGRARAVLTRVRTTNGREHADIRVRVALADIEPAARRQLGRLLADLETVVTRAALAGRPRPGRHA